MCWWLKYLRNHFHEAPCITDFFVLPDSETASVTKSVPAMAASVAAALNILLTVSILIGNPVSSLQALDGLLAPRGEVFHGC